MWSMMPGFPPPATWARANGAPDLVAPDYGINKVDFAGYFGNPVVEPALNLVSAIQNGDLKNFTLLHMLEPDTAGHGFGWTITPGSNYRAAVQMVDAKLGAILDTIAGNPLYAGHTAIILTADHGGGGTNSRSHGDPTALGEITIPFFVLAPGLPGGADLYHWMENRFDPKSTRPDYGSPAPSLRNGDAGNLSLALLGLPPIPGSYLRPIFVRPVKVEFHAATGAEVSWPLYLTGHTLEWSETLAGWLPITAGVTESANERRYLDAWPLPQARFYRLRAP